MNEVQSAASERKYVTVKQLAAEGNIPLTEASLRWHVFRADENGLAPAIRRIGRRVLIDREGFFRWIDKGVAA